MSYDDPDGECMPDPLDVVTYTYSYVEGLVTLPYSYTSCPGAVCEHDGDQGVFRLTEPDGTTTEFRDRAVRFLLVQPDPETGEPVPVMERGEPKVIYLCREAGL